jgi:hypothetical protein
MPRVEFEPTNPVFGRARTIHALDRAATVVGAISNTFYINHSFLEDVEVWILMRRYKQQSRGQN